MRKGKSEKERAFFGIKRPVSSTWRARYLTAQSSSGGGAIKDMNKLRKHPQWRDRTVVKNRGKKKKSRILGEDSLKETSKGEVPRPP